MKKTFIFILTICFSLTAIAQMQKVYFSYSENSFDGNMPLPAEEKFIIKGRISTEVDIVKVEIYKDLRSKKPALYSVEWRRGQDLSADEFSVIMHQKLRQDNEYDFVIRYYRKTTQEERKYTASQLREQMTLYLDNNAVKDGKQWKWSKNPTSMIGNMNNIIANGLERFTNQDGKSFEGFSDNIKVTLLNLEEHTSKMKKRDSTVVLLSQEVSYFNKLADQLTNEVQQYIHGELYFAFDERQVLRYQTEELKNVIAINAGYGGVWFNDKKNNEKYDHAPFVGISVPFGNKALSKPFWSNVTLSTGVFLLNFEDKDGNQVSGPIVQRPLYLGLGYKFLRFVKIQGGVTMLETKVEEGNFVNFDEIYFRPYVGLSLEFNFWMDFAK